MEKILIIKHGALGDFIQALGFMRAIQALHPQARFTLLTMAPFVKMGEQSGIFSEIIVDNRVSWSRWRENARVLKAILSGGYTHVYDLQGTSRTRTYRRIWRLLSPAGVRQWHVGHPLSPAPCMYTVSKRCRLLPGRQSAQPYRIDAPKTDLSFMHGEGKHFDRLPQRYVLLIPGCSAKHAYKRWPVENYREIVRRLAAKGLQAVLLGTKDEADVAEAIAQGNPSVVNMVGFTGLLDVPQVALRALAVLGNDTGPSHMAAYTGVYTLALFDRRNSGSILRGILCESLVSEGAVDLISPDEVWNHLAAHLPS